MITVIYCHLRRWQKNILLYFTTKEVLAFLKNEPRASEEHFRHFTKLHDWTAASRNEWSSVQEWYVSLLEEKII